MSVCVEANISLESGRRSEEPSAEDVTEKDVEELVTSDDVGKGELTAYQSKEAELNAHLEAMKPKQRTIKEMLMAMPGYKDLVAIKPKLGGENGKKQDFIILDDNCDGKKKPPMSKKQRGIEALKDRFVRHCITQPVKHGKGEHVKLK